MKPKQVNTIQSGWLFLLGFLFALKPIWDADVWWHLAAGRHLWESKQFIYSDPFSFTFRGFPWVDITWGYELILYGLYRCTENYLLIQILMALMGGACAYLAWRIYTHLALPTQGSRVLAFLCFVVAINFVDVRWNHRPEQFSHLFGLLYLYILILHRDQRTLYVLPFIQLLWVNTHGLFILGPVIWGIFWAVDCVKKGLKKPTQILKSRLTQVGVFIGLVCLINPLGFKGAIFPFHLLSLLNNRFFQTTIPEATRPLLDARWEQDTQFLVCYIAILIGALLAQVFFLKKNKNLHAPSFVDTAYFFLFLGLCQISFSARRNISLLVLWTLPWGVCQLQKALSPVFTRSIFRISALREGLVYSVLGIACCFLLTNQWMPRFSQQAFSWVRKNPAVLVPWINSLPHKVRFFGDVDFSNKLLWDLPGYEPYIDSRFAEVYPVPHFRHYMDILAHPKMIEEEAQKYQIEAVGIRYDLPLEQALIRYLYKNPNWKLAFIGEGFIVFLGRNRLEEFKSVGGKFKSERELFSEAASILKQEKNQQAYFQLLALSLLIEEESLVEMLYGELGKLSGRVDKFIEMSCLVEYFKLYKTIERTQQGIQAPAPLQEDLIGKVATQCRQSYRQTKSLAVLMTLAGLHYNTGRHDLAKREAEEAVTRDPLNFEAQLLLARSLSSLPVPVRDVERQYYAAARLRPYNEEPIRELEEFRKSRQVR